jgi:hypothetical protein
MKVKIKHLSITDGMDADDLCDWTGSSTLIEAYPEYHGDYLRGNRGRVSSVAIEKPHRHRAYVEGLLGCPGILQADAVDVLHSDEEEPSIRRRGRWVIAVAKIIDGEDPALTSRLNDVALAGVCEE